MKDLYTDRLDLKVPKEKEQKRIWEILTIEDVNKYYFPTPDRIFRKNNLNKENIDDLKLARKIFMESFKDWKIQEPFYKKKIESIESGNDYTWSIFLKDTDIVIGQITCQNSEYDDEKIRDVGWFIDPDYQGLGYATEAARRMLEYMFNEIKITDIYTSAAMINPASWKIMERLGFEYIGTKKSTYFKDNEILISKKYHLNKDLFFKNNKK